MTAAVMTTGPQADFQLRRHPLGRLVLTDAAGVEHLGVTPVRAFPIAAPDEGLSWSAPKARSWPGCHAWPNCRRPSAR
jgi:hypothetical protein